MKKRVLQILMIFCSIFLTQLKTYSQTESNVITNQFLQLNYVAKNEKLSLTDRKTGKSVLSSQIQTLSGNKTQIKEINNSVFGKGKSMEMALPENRKVVFSLFPTVPFLFVTYSVQNNTADTINISILPTWTFTADLGKPAAELKTLGTGGLFAPDKNPGSYVFLTTVDPATRHGIVAGWLTHEKGDGVLFSCINNGKVEIKTRIDYGRMLILPGKTEITETIVVGYFDDARLGEERFADLLAKQYNIHLPERFATYCTWYAEKNGGAGNEASTIELAKFVAEHLKKYGMGAIQIDDEWQSGEKYNGPRRGFDKVRADGPYPNGMTATTKAIKDAGLKAGIWWMPFARNHQAPEYTNRKDWFAYRTNGKPYETSWGGTSLDLTQPAVRQQIKEFSTRLTDWGFDYFKMDGLWTGTVTEQIYINDGYRYDSIGNCKPLHNPMVTQIEAYRSGLKLIRDVTAGKVYLSGCNVSQNMRSFGASIGLVHSMRIGPDYSHEDGIKTGPLRASRLYFLNGKVWWNDPDPAIIRESGASGADTSSKGVGDLDRARVLPSFAAITGDFYLSSDWLPDLPEERLDIMKRTMMSHKGTVRPIDAFDKSLPEMWLVTDKKSGAERIILGLFNWSKTEENIGTTMQWAGLDPNAVYYAYDFWENKILPDVSNTFSYKLNGETVKSVALRKMENHPVIVSTSQHIMQGMTDILKERWNKNTLTATSKLIAGDKYEVRLAGLNAGKKWRLKQAKLHGNYPGVSIRILSQNEEGWLKLVITSDQNREVTWSVLFQ